MYATLTAAALGLALGQPPTLGGVAQPAAPAAGPALDGNWTVVVLEKNGKAVQDAAKNMTVSIRGNVVTFNKTVGAAAGEAMALRVEFGRNGTVRVSEGATDNKFGATQPAVPPGTTPGSTGPDPGVRTGVYVLTQDYLAVCVHDTTTGAAPVTATGAQPPQPGGTSGVGDGRLPAHRSYVTVILRREEGSRPRTGPGR